ncbi:MAG TPA: sulfite exporter TauE/SafE family protein [Planctomycetota bacterium]|nr:sulfite exporter TauE/SafE family protein [Planctomycetota bacterium]
MDFIHSWIVPPDAVGGPLAYVIAAMGALFLVSVDKGGLNAGIAIMAVPLFLQVAPAKFVIGLWLPVLIVCDFCTVRNYPSEWQPRAISKLWLPVIIAVIGTTILLNSINLEAGSPQARQLDAWLKLSVAIISVSFLLLKLRPAPDGEAPPWQPTHGASWLVGIIGGVTTTIAHAAGPIVTMYLLPQKLDRREYVGTSGRFYFLLNVLKLPSFVYVGLTNWTSLRYALWLMVIAPFGVGLGSWLNKRMDPVWFVRIIHASLVLVAIKFALDAWKVMS